jgi:hypothetical protein
MMEGFIGQFVIISLSNHYEILLFWRFIMSDMKVLVTDGLEENGLEILRGSINVVEHPGISADELLQVIGDFDALIIRGRTKVTPGVF